MPALICPPRLSGSCEDKRERERGPMGEAGGGAASTLLEKFWQILLYVTDDAIAKLYLT